MAKEKNEEVIEEDIKDVKNPKKESGKSIAVNEATLRELIESNKKLMDSNEELRAQVDILNNHAAVNSKDGTPIVRRRAQEHDYVLRKWNDKYVLGFSNVGKPNIPVYVYNVFDKDTRQTTQYIDLILEGEKEPLKKVPYIEFLREAERVTVRKISQEEKEEVKEYGYLPKKEMAANGYGMIETMVMVPVEVVSKKYIMTVKDPEGKELKVADSVLNI